MTTKKRQPGRDTQTDRGR